jgi:DNA modification methylase
MRQIVAAVLPLGKGVILDPFAGSGATLAAAEFVGVRSIGIEINKTYFKMAQRAIPTLATFQNGTSGGDGRDSKRPIAKEFQR